MERLRISFSPRSSLWLRWGTALALSIGAGLGIASGHGLPGCFVLLAVVACAWLTSHRGQLARHAAAGIASIRIDTRGRILAWSPGATHVFGYRRTDVLGRNVAMLMPEPFASEHDGYLARYCADQTPGHSRVLGATRHVVGRHRDGHELPLLLHVQPGRHGTFDGLLHLVPPAGPARADIDDNLQAPRIAWRWLRNLGHEIRTPMAGLHSHAEILVDPASTADERQAAAAAVLRHSGHLLELVNDLLDHARLAAGQMPIRLTGTPVRELVQDVVGLLRAAAEQKGLQLATQVAADVPSCVGTDPLRLRQILTNLLGNAVKFTDRGFVRLEVSTASRRGAPVLRFEVCDSGCGIDRNFATALFQPFQQDAVQSARGNGSGLGLSICRQLARLLGGDVTLVDSVPGVGSRFRLEIARSDVPDSVPMTAQPQGQLTGARILLVDDADDLRLATRRFLQAAGGQIDDFADPIRVLREVSDLACYDLVVLDLMMPGMSGYELAQELRQRGFSGPLVALSADGGSDLDGRCSAAGFCKLLQKPIRRSDLIAALSLALTHRSES
ncbi:MAG: response regulator [Planctomycetes bacterium]|nr:response regulator [Planctomycetota bacterium]